MKEHILVPIPHLLRRRLSSAAIPHFAFVRSAASLLRRTHRWDSTLTALSSAASLPFNPSAAAHIITKLPHPHLALRFLRWLRRRPPPFPVDASVYSATLRLLSQHLTPSYAAIAAFLLQEEIAIGLKPSPSDLDSVIWQWVHVGRWDLAIKLAEDGGSLLHGFRVSARSSKAIIQALFHAKHGDLALNLFRRMRTGDGYRVDGSCFNVVMKFLCKEGRMEDARKVFDGMPESGCAPDLDSFNILIRGYSEKGDVESLCGVFQMMLDVGVKPDSYTVNLLIKELCKQGRPECGNQLFNHMRRMGWIEQKFVYTRLVASLCDHGWWPKALKVFVKMVRRGHHPSVELYENLVACVCLGGEVTQAFHLKDAVAKKRVLEEMDNYNALINGLCLAGRMAMVKRVLAEIGEKGLSPNFRTHSLVLRGHCVARNGEEALDWMEKMKANGWDVHPELLETMIVGLSMEGMVDKALRIKKCAGDHCHISGTTYKVLLRDLVKLGRMNRVMELTEELEARENRPDGDIYNTIIDGLCESRKVDEAYTMLDKMTGNGWFPAYETYGSLVAALSAKGKVSEVLEVWEGMAKVEHRPDVSLLIVDKLCEVGLLDAAERIICRMFECDLLPGKDIFSVYLSKLFGQEDWHQLVDHFIRQSLEES